ncbi:MAG: NUDIX hydrolase [Acidimicrobiia bacterium]|nr:NUDIX hydrolase [Acidimicrobiia bacterium]
MSDPDLVRAAGGVVVRPGMPAAAEPQVLIVHRPHRLDWSLPKGKREPGEDDPACARREVLEETGLQCRLVSDLGATHYRDAKGRPKIVRWWAMDVTGGALTANDEVDDFRWLPVPDALGVLSYDTDRSVLARFARRWADDQVAVEGHAGPSTGPGDLGGW